MKRPIFWATLYFISGIYFRLGISEMICLVFVLFILFSLLYFLKRYHNWKVMILLFFALAGFLMADASQQKEMLDEALDGVVFGEGVIKETGITSSDNQKMAIQCDILDADGNKAEDVLIYAIWTEDSRFTEGNRISFSGELMPFYTASVPAGYDEDLYLRTKGYDGKMYPDTIEYRGEDNSFTSSLARTRGRVHETLDKILPVTESGIMKAMLTGDKDEIPDEAYDMYRDAGVVHILCISGLHMSILALYVSFFMERILKQSRRISAVVTMLAAVGFLVFVGFTPSAVRAVTMICVVMLARMIFRSHDRLNEISIAAMLILLIEPLYLFHIGFQLSFVTVLGLCVAAEQIEIKNLHQRKPLDWLKDSIRFSLYASLFSYPLVAYHFYSVSLAGIIANLVVIPLSGVLLGFGILAAVLGMILQPAGVFTAGSVYGILKFLEVVCKALLQLPFACVKTGRPTELVIILCYALLFFWLKYADRKSSWKGAVILCLLLWCAIFENQIFYKENTVTFLDVGQGDAAVISTYDGKTYLIDGGGEYGKAFGKNVGKTVLLPYLESLGVDHIDAAVLSHPDTDHMTGLLEILDEVPVQAVYLSDYPYLVTENIEFLKENLEKYPMALYAVNNKTVSPNEEWEVLYTIDDVTFENGDDNHGSMVLMYQYHGTKVLFTGDIGFADEEILLQRKGDLSADILKVSHHGSSNGTSEEFLEQLGAETAIISCGENNIYGHPHDETLVRLKDENIKVHRTDVDGTILLRMKQNGTYEIETMTERMPLYERIEKKLEIG